MVSRSYVMQHVFYRDLADVCLISFMSLIGREHGELRLCALFGFYGLERDIATQSDLFDNPLH